MTSRIYRAKRLDNQHWIYGYHLIISNTHYIYTEAQISAGERVAVDPNTLCEHIGLNDCNHDPIFTGDMIQCGNCRVVIKFGYYCPKLYAKKTYKNYQTIGYYGEDELGRQLQLSGNSERYCVVGNIYDDPNINYE